LYGGLRIRTLKSYSNSSDTPLIKRFFYNGFPGSGGADTVSSGSWLAMPEYSYDKSNCLLWSGGGCCSFRVFNCVSNYPLSSGGGRPVAYKYVTIFDGLNGENGKMEMTYTTYEDYPDSADYSFPFPSNNDREWRRGLLLNEKMYAMKLGGYVPLQEKKVVYTFHEADSTRKYVRSIKIAKNVDYVDASSFSLTLTGLEDAGYLTVAEAFNISSDTLITYGQDDPAKSIKVVKDYEFTKNNFMPRQISTRGSLNEIIKSKFYYPLDYSVTGSGNIASKGIYNLQQKHVNSSPIEIYVTKTQDGGQEYIQHGVVNTYKPSRALRDSVFRIEASPPVLLSSFSQSSINGSNNFVKDNIYKPVLSFTRYDTSANVREMQKINDIVNTYIWDYSLSQPIAECKNADSASISYSSFEADGKGGWTFAGSNSVDATSPTGGKCYLTSGGNITRTGLVSNTYIVSYWGKNGSVAVNGFGPARTGKTVGNWTYYEHEVTATSITVSGSNYIDELRLYPKGAQMVTYTHSPLIGVTSQCDAANKITYYEYDTFNRLKLVRDQDKNVIKVIDYKYNQAQNQ
jgi:hypothetical protein